jgi:hypothetical protein
MAIARFTLTGLALLAGVAAAEQPAAPMDEQERRSYALGMAVGKHLRSESVKVDPDLYRQGLADALSGDETRLTEAEGRAAVHRLQLELKQRRRAPPEKLVAAAAGGLQVSFKLDPRVTKGLYMGERWVSGPSFSSASVPEGQVVTIEARARGAGTGAAATSPTWSASHPEVVTITPSSAGAVTLTIRDGGESTFTVTSGQRSSVFAVRAVRQGGHWRVALSKLERATVPAAVTAAAGTPAGRSGE